MGLISFIKNAGEKIFGGGKEEAEKNAPVEKKQELGAQQLANHIKSLALKSDDVKVALAGDKVILNGTVEKQEDAEKIVLAVGNVEGVGSVENNLKVTTPAQEAQYHTVEKGEWLSKIAQKYYNDPQKFNVIFEANKPMLKDPDKIYPGQVLRIPPLEKSA